MTRHAFGGSFNLSKHVSRVEFEFEGDLKRMVILIEYFLMEYRIVLRRKCGPKAIATEHIVYMKLLKMQSSEYKANTCWYETQRQRWCSIIYAESLSALMQSDINKMLLR